MGKDLKITLLAIIFVFFGGVFQETVVGKSFAIVGAVVFMYYFVKGLLAWWKSR